MGLRIQKVSEFPPNSNPFLHDRYHMGTQIAKNVTIMGTKFDTDNCLYFYICNTKTGERHKVMLDGYELSPREVNFINILNDRDGVSNVNESSPIVQIRNDGTFREWKPGFEDEEGTEEKCTCSGPNDGCHVCGRLSSSPWNEKCGWSPETRTISEDEFSKIYGAWLDLDVPKKLLGEFFCERTGIKDQDLEDTLSCEVADRLIHDRYIRKE